MVSRRERFLQPLCWFFCCGCVPFYGFLKGLLCMIPCSLVFTVVSVLTIIILYPGHFVMSYWSLLKTSRLGPNMKVISVIGVIVPLLVYPPLVILGALCFSVGYALVTPIIYTFDDDKNFWYGGIVETISNCITDHLAYFIKFCREESFDDMKRYRNDPLREGETPFEVNLQWIPLSIFYATIGVIVVLPAAVIIAAIKYIPALIRGYYEIWKFYLKESWKMIAAFSWLFVLINLVLPVVSVLCIIAFLVVAIFMGATAADAAYRRGHVAGFRRIVNNVYELDERTNGFIFKKSTCLPCLNMEENVF